MTFADGVRKRLKELRMSQNELAKLAGMSSSGLSTIMSGKARPREDSIAAIASALGCSVASLYEDSVVIVSATNPPKDFTDEEKLLVAAYRRASPERQAIVMEILGRAE